MNSKEMAADFHRSGRDQAIGIPGDDALQSIENVFRSRFGAEREPVVKRRDEGSPVSRSKSWPSRIAAPFTIS